MAEESWAEESLPIAFCTVKGAVENLEEVAKEAIRQGHARAEAAEAQVSADTLTLRKVRARAEKAEEQLRREREASDDLRARLEKVARAIRYEIDEFQVRTSPPNVLTVGRLAKTLVIADPDGPEAKGLQGCADLMKYQAAAREESPEPCTEENETEGSGGVPHTMTIQQQVAVAMYGEHAEDSEPCMISARRACAAFADFLGSEEVCQLAIRTSDSLPRGDENEYGRLMASIYAVARAVRGERIKGKEEGKSDD